MHWSVLLIASSSALCAHAGAVTTATGMHHDSTSLPRAIDTVTKRAAHGLTALLPKTFPLGASGSLEILGKRFSLTFSHGDLVDGNYTVPALHVGAEKLQPALRAAIDAASSGPSTQAPDASFSTTFNELEIAVWPSPSNPTPLLLTSADYTTVLQVLLKDTEQNPRYQTLYSALIKDQDGVVYACLGIMAPLHVVQMDEVLVNALNDSIPTQSTPLLSPSRRLTSSGKGKGKAKASASEDSRYNVFPFARLLLINQPQPVQAAVTSLPENELHEALMVAMSSLRLSLQVAMNTDVASRSAPILAQTMYSQWVVVRGIAVEFYVEFWNGPGGDGYAQMTPVQGLAFAGTLTSVMHELRPGEQPMGFVDLLSRARGVGCFGVNYYNTSTGQRLRPDTNGEDPSEEDSDGQGSGSQGSVDQGTRRDGSATVSSGRTQTAGNGPEEAATVPPDAGSSSGGQRVEPMLDPTWGQGTQYPWASSRQRPDACAVWETCQAVLTRT